MTSYDPERTAMIERIKIAANALEIPQEAVDHVIKKGTSFHRSSHTTVLFEFAEHYGVSLDYLITGKLDTMFRSASLWLRATSKAA